MGLDSCALLVWEVAELANPSSATFDQLAEEVMELHLALRGKHSDAPVLEWLEIASLALNALAAFGIEEVHTAFNIWTARHGQRE